MDKSLKYYWKKKTILSFLAIVFVVIIHNSATNQYIVTEDFFTNFTYLLRNFFAYGLGSIAVPIFFLISGISMFRNYKPKLYPQKLRSRTKTLLIPYLIWNIIGLLFCILYTYTPLSNYISGREIFEPTIQNIFAGIFLYKYNFQFWFLFELIIFVILTPIFDLLTSNKFLSFIFFIIFLILPIFTESFLNLNLHFVVFYYLGCYLGKYHLKTFTRPSTLKISLVSGVFLLILSIIKILPLYNLLELPTIISQIVLIIMTISAWFFSDSFIQKIKQPKFADEFFPVYALHTYFLATIIKIIYLVAPHTSWMLLINEISSPILSILIVTLIASLWHQKLPKSYSILFGRPLTKSSK